MKDEQRDELLYQALETELGGVQIYTKAVQCAVNKDLKKEWEKYLDQTKRHVEIVEGIFEALGLDTATVSPGRKVVKHIGESLVKAMEMAASAGVPGLFVAADSEAEEARLCCERGGRLA